MRFERFAWLVLCGHGVNARSVGQLLLRGQSRNATDAVHGVDGGKTLKLPSLDAGTLLAAGRLDHLEKAASEMTDAELLAADIRPYDPDRILGEAILERMDTWLERVESVQKSAETQRRLVVQKETELSRNFTQAMMHLESKRKEATTEADNAKTTALMERLSRIHYDKVAMLDRSARFWEERIAEEEKLARIAAAKVRLEQSAISLEKMQAGGSRIAMKQLEASEKEGLKSWLTTQEEHSRAEEEAGQQTGFESEPHQSNEMQVTRVSTLALNSTALRHEFTQRLASSKSR
eukprot:TRINITY_DN15233_c0_g1_i1.p1 TRINITY_DN15233_c0_g1~~TRINITY_DN15233_c0_g1_i1.p1  ORF type:complete len:292 (+),score=54.95 TRINITY_DN15233_c0_g1_i1:120-995(+)